VIRRIRTPRLSQTVVETTECIGLVFHNAVGSIADRSVCTRVSEALNCSKHAAHERLWAAERLGLLRVTTESGKIVCVALTDRGTTLVDDRRVGEGDVFVPRGSLRKPRGRERPAAVLTDLDPPVRASLMS
jgi:hypothetical protein